MHKNSVVISNFHRIPSKYSSSQEDTLNWIVSSHVKAESLLKTKSVHELESFENDLRNKLLHVGCKSDSIAARGHEIGDFLHTNWNEMMIYRLDENPQGLGLTKRQEVHRKIVDHTFERFYPRNENPPHDLLHVSCTGYASPSGAQKIVSKHRWENQTSVSHVYHMGCYAALPAVRIAQGLTNYSARTSEIVHTEICTLHMNPSIHTPEQLVAQSLFADGFIKYSVSLENEVEKSQKSFLRILSMHEQIIPESTQSMEWLMTDWGFQFVLAKEIPILVGRRVEEYLKTLCQKAGLSHPEKIFEEAVFAIHPGGPKILQSVQKALRLRNEQIETSLEILKQHGNMSSATLPHVWQSICQNSKIPSGTKVFSVAFGPGLTIAGALLEKV